MNTRRVVLGLSYSTHDLSACLMVDGAPLVAIARERLTRIKHDGGWSPDLRRPGSWDPSLCVDYCLEHAGLAMDDVDLIVENHVLNPAFDAFHRDVASGFKTPLPVEKSVMISHHLAHAYSTCLASGFSDSTILVIDGMGNSAGAVTAYEGEDASYLRSIKDPVDPASRRGETLSMYFWDGTSVAVLRKDLGTASVGLAYRAVTGIIFGSIRDAGKTMGLAPYGEPGRCPSRLISCHDGKISYPYVSSLGQVEWPAPPTRWPEVDLWTPEHWMLADLARAIQDQTEQAVLDLALDLRRRCESSRLCLAGGVALNSVSNRRILDEAGFRDVFVVPAAGDDGISLGCAYWGNYNTLNKNEKRFISGGLTTASLGGKYDKREVLRASRVDARLVAVELNEPDFLATTARAIVSDQVVGWFVGGSEFGPRALGHRSILANALNPSMKDILNRRVKFRENFRPFAPAVIEEAASAFFECDQPSPFMLFIARVRSANRDLLSAVTHVDGTARLQTVTHEHNRLFYELLRTVGQLTGIPIVINTSFNVRGQPIVETPEQAVDCLLATDLDALAIDGLWITKRQLSRDEMIRAVLTVPDHATFNKRFVSKAGSLQFENASGSVASSSEVTSEITAPLLWLLEHVDSVSTVRQIATSNRMHPEDLLPHVSVGLARNWLRVLRLADDEEVTRVHNPHVRG